MLKYLIIILDDTAPSFCYCDNAKTERKPMPLDILKKGVLFAMKENLSVQFVCPDYELPSEYALTINEIDYTTIGHKVEFASRDIYVADDIASLSLLPENSIVALRLNRRELFGNSSAVFEAAKRLARVNLIVKDSETFKDEDFTQYKKFLEGFSDIIATEHSKGHLVQANVLTDRLSLDEMNNCNAGWESITLAPDGGFYVCPSFYYDGSQPVGNIDEGIRLKNSRLYRFDHAPICQKCDAWQCKRCVWLNKRMTKEVSIPSHEQCVMAHIERNASRRLSPDIPEIEYLDPFENIKQ